MLNIPWATITPAVITSIVTTITTVFVAPFVKRGVFERPRVSLTVDVIPATVPLVLFRVVNHRSETVHITPIMGRAVTAQGDKKNFMVAPHKLSMKLEGLAVETFTAPAHEVFPKDYFVRQFYVEDVTADGRRWRAPRRQFKEVMETTKNHVASHHDVILWGVFCTDCGGTVYWYGNTAKASADGYEYRLPSAKELPDLAGWTPLTFENLPEPMGRGTCPGCVQRRVLRTCSGRATASAGWRE